MPRRNFLKQYAAYKFLDKERCLKLALTELTKIKLNHDNQTMDISKKAILKSLLKSHIKSKYTSYDISPVYTI